MADADYAYWFSVLDSVLDGKDPLPVHDSDPQSGFYRARKHKGGPLLPVAIWRRKSGEMVATINGKPTDAQAIWSFACKNAVTQQAYDFAIKGGAWADMDEAVTESMKPVDRHHNEPPDELRILDDQIDSAVAGVDKYAEIKTQDQLNAAQSLRARLNELAGQADKERETAKAPHLKAAKAVDKLWKPLIDKAKDAAEVVKRGMKAFLDAKIAAETAAAAKGEGGEDGAPPPPLPKVKGAYGRAATTEMVKVASGILSIDELFAWPPMHNHPELHDFMLALAQKAVNKGLSPPGVRVVEEVKIR
jgi:hypothetical protein